MKEKIWHEPSPWRWVWWGALVCFAVAGSTGAWLRFGLISGFPWGLQYFNMRHAHSHLMYFGWVTPALMGLMLVWLPRLTGRPFPPRRARAFRLTVAAIFVLALAAYAAFLNYGYQTAVFGDLRLPLSTIMASLNMVAWYVFAWLYWRQTRGAPRTPPLRLWDAALIFLLLATMGAWGVAGTAVFHLQNPLWSALLTHLFLDLFAEGWFVLAVLGLLHAMQPAPMRGWMRQSEGWLLIGLPVIFFIGVPDGLLPLPIRLVGGAGALAVAYGLAGQLVHFWRQAPAAWRLPLAALGIKVVSNVLVAVPPLAVWAERAGLRIVYLHWVLLGFVTLSLLAAARTAWGARVFRGYWLFSGAVLLLLASLLTMTTLWPAPLRGGWVRPFVAWVSLGPPLLLVWQLITARLQPWRRANGRPVNASTD